MMNTNDIEVISDNITNNRNLGEQKNQKSNDDDDEAVVVDVDVDGDSETLVLTSAPSTSGEQKLQVETSLPTKEHKSSVAAARKGTLNEQKYHFSERTSVGNDHYVSNVGSYTVESVEAVYSSNESHGSPQVSEVQATLDSRGRTSKLIRDQWHGSVKEENDLQGGTFLEEVCFSEWKFNDKKYPPSLNAERLSSLNSSGKHWSVGDKMDRRNPAKRKQPSCDGSITASTSSSVPIFSARSKRLTLSSIVVPEEDEQLVRVYRFNSKSRDGRTMYYRCSKCDTLCNNDKKSGIVRGTVLRASLKTINGQIAGDAHPKHHPECKPISAQTFRTGRKYRHRRTPEKI